MFLGANHQREKLADLVKKAVSTNCNEELKAALNEWLENKDNAEASKAATKKVLPLIEANKTCCETMAELYKFKDFFVKRSQWIFGGDGWAYDIGYGGVDHVLASGEDVNVFVFDTEVYSNTGGQSSKATPTAAIAKFAASGKRTKKKDLGMMAMSYGYVYVAQIAMGNTQLESKKAVACGYWGLYRFNPALKEEGKNPFSLDSKEPTESFRDFLLNEVRYASLQKMFPEVAEELFVKTEQDAKERLESYKKLAAQQ